MFLGGDSNNSVNSKGSRNKQKIKSGNKNKTFKKKRKASYETHSYFSKKETGNKSQPKKNRKGSYEEVNLNQFGKTRKNRKKSYEQYDQYD